MNMLIRDFELFSKRTSRTSAFRMYEAGASVEKSCKKAQNLWLSCSWCQIFLHFAFKWCIFRLFIDLRTFVAKFLCRDLRTFFADFFVTEKQTPQTFLLLECMFAAWYMQKGFHKLFVFVGIESWLVGVHY